MTLVVIVPYRRDGGHRDRLWRRLRDTYWRGSPLLLVGEHTEGPFNRSAAINAAARSGEWSTAVIADADTWVDRSQLLDAVVLAERSGRLVAAFDSVVELNRPTTEAIVCGDLSLAHTDSFTADRVRTADLETQSSMLVVTRALFDAVGGFDDRFAGWGGEDNAFWKACAIMAGDPYRVRGPAWHLWHPVADGKHHGPSYRANVRRWRRYAGAVTETDLRRAQQ